MLYHFAFVVFQRWGWCLVVNVVEEIAWHRVGREVLLALGALAPLYRLTEVGEVAHLWPFGSIHLVHVVDERTIVDDVEDGEEEEAHTFSAQAARVFGEFGCFASNYEEIHGGPPQESGKMHKAYTQIRNMDLEDAVDTLESIGTSNRNGRWYYYYAMADLLLGEHEEALRFAGRAAQEAPNNVEIQDFYQKTVQVIRDWLKKHPEDGPEILFTRERLIRFCIGLAIFLVLAFFIYWKTGVITF